MGEILLFAHSSLLLHLILGGRLKEVKRAGKADVESKLGKRSCDGESGRLELPYFDDAPPLTVSHRLHSDAPFGVVTTQWTCRPDSGSEGTAKYELKLTDYGEDATSQIPDAQ